MSTRDRVTTDSPEAGGAFDQELSRGDLLKGAAALGAAGALAGFGGLPSSAFGAVRQKPKRGGRLRLAMIGGGQAESFDPGKVGLSADSGAARAANLYDTLTFIKPDLTGYRLGLAQSIEPDNAKRTSWTIRLRPGITFHDGSPLTADDVIYTIKRAASDPSNGAYVFTRAFDVKRIKKLDDLTLRLPLTRPLADLRAFLFPAGGLAIVKNGAKDFRRPIGTGPFMFKSFKVGVSSLMVRNPDYWQSGRPYVDELEINSVEDASARFTALQSGVVDGISFVPFPQARALLAGQRLSVGIHHVRGLDLLISAAPSHVYFTMRVDRPPFTNNDVRLAMKLIADRPALVKTVNSGFGGLGNDIRFPRTRFYDNQLPQRHQDLDKAKFLLKRAGMDGLKVTLQTSDWAPGMLDSATVFARQAKAAGVTIDINNTEAGNYFANQYLKVPFSQSFATPFPIPVMYSLQLVTGGIWNETHWNYKSYDNLVFAAQGEPNPAKAEDLWFEAQKIVWQRGGDLIWGTTPFVDGLSSKVRGAKPNRWGALSGFDFRNYWLAA
jgi:peptide/nickel transport system substrate-binding protein